MAGTPAIRDSDEQLRQELLRIHEDSYGAGAGRITIMSDEDSVIVFLDDLELQPSEQFLIESGRPETVSQMRSEFQEAIGSTFRAAVERTTGRRVVSFASVIKLNPHYSVEIFRLGERSKIGEEELRYD